MVLLDFCRSLCITIIENSIRFVRHIKEKEVFRLTANNKRYQPLLTDQELLAEFLAVVFNGKETDNIDEYFRRSSKDPEAMDFAKELLKTVALIGHLLMTREYGDDPEAMDLAKYVLKMAGKNANGQWNFSTGKIILNRAAAVYKDPIAIKEIEKAISIIDDAATGKTAKRQEEVNAKAEVVRNQAIEVLAKFDDLFKESVVFLGNSDNPINLEDLGTFADLFEKSISEVDTEGMKRIFKSLLTKNLKDYIHDMAYSYDEDLPSSLENKRYQLSRAGCTAVYFEFIHNVVREMAKRLKKDGKKELADALVKKSKDAFKEVRR